MSYFIKQTIGKNKYIYEVTSFWDSNSKKSKQKRKYVGKLTPEGEIIMPKKSMKIIEIQDFGNVYLLQQISETTGLCDILRTVFPDEAKDIINIAIFLLIAQTNNYKTWSKRNNIESQLSYVYHIEDFFKKIANSEDKIDKFFRLWSAKQNHSQCVYYDVGLTLGSSNITDWYYNEDSLNFKLNFGVAFSKATNIPIFYQLYLKNIIDADLLENVYKFSINNNIEIDFFIIRPDFCTQYDINKISKLPKNFLLPINSNTLLPKNILNRIFNDSDLKKINFEKNNYLYTKKNIELYNSALILHVFLNEQKKIEQIDSFIGKLSDLETIVNNKVFRNTEELIFFMENKFKGSAGLYNTSCNSETVMISKKKHSVSKLFNKAGKMALITNDVSIGSREILFFKKEKDIIENFFKKINSEVNRYSLKSKEYFKGRFFVYFITLIIYKTLTLKIQKKDTLSKYTLDEILNNLQRIKKITFSNNNTILSDITTEQKRIFDELHIKVPK
jgi:transposase